MSRCSEVTLCLRMTVLKEKYRMLSLSHEYLESEIKNLKVSNDETERLKRAAEKESELRFALENTAPSLHTI